MQRQKAFFITSIIVVLVGTLIYLLWANAIRSYWVVCQIIALYGFIRGSFDLGKWIAKPTETRSLPRGKSPSDYTKRGWEV